MPRLPFLVSLAAAALVLGGCCRDTIREMSSLKDGMAPRAQKRAVHAHSARTPETRSAKAERNGEAKALETGSVKQPDCQGPHIAYQATREYLKNFGPKPPDQPGERGPCEPAAR